MTDKKMAGTSNKTLAYLLVLAIAVTAVGILTPRGIDITGLVTDTGTSTATVSATTFLNFTVATVAWGTGTVGEGLLNCTLDTEGTTTNCVSFSAVSTPLRLENLGNTNVSLNLTSSVNAADFIGGTNPVFRWKLAEGEANACLGGTSTNCNSSTGYLSDTTYTDVNTAGKEVCPCFLSIDATDLINIDLNVTIPSDAVAGSKSATITATGTAI